MAQQYDRIIKENIQSVVLELLRSTTNLNFTDYKLIFPELPKTIEREADFVIQFKNAAGTTELIHLEFQTFNDDKMLERMLLYFGLLRYMYKIPIRQFVFYIGEAPLRMKNHYHQVNVDFMYELVDLEAISYRAFLESDTPEMVILAILTDFETKDSAWIVEQIFKRLIELDKDPTNLQKHVRQLDILSVLRNLQSIVIKQEKIMGLTLNIENDLRFQQGREEGKEEGKEEGREEGREEIARAMLADGFEVATISKLTKLTIAEIQAIQNEQQAQ